MKIALCYVSDNLDDYVNDIYSLFMRDKDDYLDDGLDIPVYSYKLTKSLYIEEEIIICLIDDEFVLKKNIFSEFYTKNKDKRYIFISFSDYFNKIDIIASCNYIDGDRGSSYITREILYELTRYILDEDKLKLFISYSRRDKDKTMIDSFIQYLKLDTKFDTFFDVNNIAYGENFEEVIEENIKNSLFLAFLTDSYSSREFCKKEILWAKKNSMPIVILNYLDKKENRSFPYMYNVPQIKVAKFENIIFEILLEALKIQNNKNKLEKIRKKSLLKYKIVSKTIEPLDVLRYKNKTILYPDPPISNDEKSLLTLRGNKLITPMVLLSKSNINKKIAISISETNDFDNGLSIEHLRDLCIEIVRFLFVTNNTIVYGGDIKYSLGLNFAEIIFELSLKYSKKKPAVINPLPTQFYKNIDNEFKLKYIDIIKFKELKNSDLSKMRKYLSQREDARVVIGGKVSGFSGKYPGVLEEAYYTLKAKKPLFIIGAFGGVAKKIVKLREGKEIKEWQGYKIYNAIKEDALNNGLSKKENTILFYSKDIEKIIGVLLKGLKNV